MNSASLNFQAPNTLQIRGELNFNSVAQLYQLGAELMAKQPIRQIDLTGVTHSNSVGLALLLEWMRTIKQQGQKVSFINMPANLQAAAEIYGVLEVLLV
jgi:phospholipid transport system transporter-binding protein